MNRFRRGDGNRVIVYHRHNSSSENSLSVILVQLSSAQWLLDHGASVTCKKKDKWQDSVQHYAAVNGHMAVVQLLLSHGADPEATNFHGATPGDLALFSGHTVVADHLMRCIQDPSLSNVCESVRIREANRRRPFFVGFRRRSRVDTKPEDRKTMARKAESEGGAKNVDFYSTKSSHGGFSVPVGDSHSPVGCHQPPHVLLNLDPGSQSTNFALEVDQIQEALSQVRFSESRHLPHDSKNFAFSRAPAIGGSNGKAPIVPSSTSILEADVRPEDVKAQLKRGFEGEGTPGTRLKRGTYLWRCFAVICQVIHIFLIRSNVE